MQRFIYLQRSDNYNKLGDVHLSTEARPIQQVEIVDVSVEMRPLLPVQHYTTVHVRQVPHYTNVHFRPVQHYTTVHVRPVQHYTTVALYTFVEVQLLYHKATQKIYTVCTHGSEVRSQLNLYCPGG